MEPNVKRVLAQMDTPGFTDSPQSSETPRHFSVKRPAPGFLSSQVPADERGLQKAGWKPATLALMLQLGALLMMLAIWMVIERYTGLEPDLYTLVILQGGIAMLLSVMCRMDIWWRAIQFLFPIGLLVTHQLALPSWIYFLGFVFFLSLFWTTFRTQVPFYPSRPDVWHRVAAYLPKDRHIHLIDIGSGLGDLIMYLARAMPESRFTGIEIAPLPWLLSRWRARLRGIGNAGFELGDYEMLDFAQYDVVFAYLSPAAMAALWQKASREMRPGSLLMSYEFEIPGAEPDCILQQEGKPSIYIWHF
jgi:hypothetical protein